MVQPHTGEFELSSEGVTEVTRVALCADREKFVFSLVCGSDEAGHYPRRCFPESPMSDKVAEKSKRGGGDLVTQNSSTGSKLVSTVWSEVIFAVDLTGGRGHSGNEPR